MCLITKIPKFNDLLVEIVTALNLLVLQTSSVKWSLQDNTHKVPKGCVQSVIRSWFITMMVARFS